MLTELNPAGFARLERFTDMLDIHLAVKAIIYGEVRARVYVNDVVNPQSVLVLAKRSFFAGQTNDNVFNVDVQRLFAEKILSDTEAQVLYYAPENWSEQIANIFSGRPMLKRAREYYRFKELKFDWRVILPPGFVLAPVNAAFFENRAIKNLDALKDEMGSERASVEDFLAKSFGLIALHNDTLAGWCLSEYNCAHACEVGIATMPPYQRLGVATALASAFVEHAQEYGVREIGWHCYASNLASGATARKVGFEKAREYDAFIVK